MDIINKLLQKFDKELFVPKTVICFREGISKKQFLNDLFAGITVGVIALPLAMAFAIGAGVAPERGLFTAIVAGLIVSLLGGSRVQIGGPTGAFIVIIFGIVNRLGYDGLALATLIAGLILIIFGITKCGTFIRFIPYPVTTGFTTGIAGAIFVNQIKDFFGLKITTSSVDFFEKIESYWHFRDTISFWALALGALAIIIIYTLQKTSKKIPGAIVAVIVTTLIAYLFHLPIDTIEKKFGAIPNMLPSPSMPAFSWKSIQLVFPDAITIAVLGAIESLLSCVVADGMTGFKHKSNLELVAQGFANIGSVLFGGIPATGAVARTTANVQLGGRTPISGIIHAITVLLLMLLLSPFAGKIPLATLAAILIVVAYNMAELEHFKEILKGPKSDALILLTTFSLTLFIDLTVAVQAGVLIAAILFLKHMTEKTTVRLCKILENEEKSKEVLALPKTPPPPGVNIFEIDGPFFFGVSDLLNEALRLLDTQPKVFILRMRSVPLVDGSGLQALKQFHKKCHKLGIVFLMCEVRADVMKIISASSVVETVGASCFFHTLDQAIDSARGAIGSKV